MAARIPKKLKKQAKQGMRQAVDIGKAKKLKRTWSFCLGDLVQYRDLWGLIIAQPTPDSYTVLTTSGTYQVRAASLSRIQQLARANTGT